MFDNQTTVKIKNAGKYFNDPMCKNIRDFLSVTRMKDKDFAQKLSDMSGQKVSRPTVTNWKKGAFRPKEKMWIYIAKILEISIIDFKQLDGFITAKELKNEVQEKEEVIKKLKEKNQNLTSELLKKTLEGMLPEKYSRKELMLHKDILISKEENNVFYKGITDK